MVEIFMINQLMTQLSNMIFFTGKAIAELVHS